MARLKKLLYPGETILLREERSVGEIAARVVMLVVAVGGLFLALYYSIKHIDRWLDSMGGMTGLLAGLLAGLLVIFLLAVGPNLLSIVLEWFSKLSPDHWRIAVTDQRVLVRRGLMGGGHDEMMHHDIENCLRDRAGGKLLLTGADRKLAIACSQPQVGRILKALGRDEAAG